MFHCNVIREKVLSYAYSSITMCFRVRIWEENLSISWGGSVHTIHGNQHNPASSFCLKVAQLLLLCCRIEWPLYRLQSWDSKEGRADPGRPEPSSQLWVQAAPIRLQVQSASVQNKPTQKSLCSCSHWLFKQHFIIYDCILWIVVLLCHVVCLYQVSVYCCLHRELPPGTIKSLKPGKLNMFNQNCREKVNLYFFHPSLLC